MRLFVEGVGIRGAGLPNWSHAEQILRGIAAYDPSTDILLGAQCLPANERRRASYAARFAIDAGLESLQHAGVDPASVATVFATSGGDGDAVHEICVALATPAREVSPTRFHNSVHNAPSGYWSIAAQSQQPSTTLSAYDASFAAGVLEAATMAHALRRHVMLISYDVPYPFPLSHARPLQSPLAIALLFATQRSNHSMCELTLAHAGCVIESKVDDLPALENLRQSIPSARALPLLHAIANHKAAALCISLGNGPGLSIDVQYQ